MIKQLLKEASHDHPERLRLQGGFEQGIPGHPSLNHEYIGELTHEHNIVNSRQKSAGAPIQGHYPAKDGVLASLLAAEAVAARNGRSNLRRIRIRQVIGGAS